MQKNSNEKQVYEALMDDVAYDIVPTYFREVEHNGECILFLLIDGLGEWLVGWLVGWLVVRSVGSGGSGRVGFDGVGSGRIGLDSVGSGRVRLDRDESVRFGSVAFP